MTESIDMKLYPWTRLARTALEARVWCPKCGTSKVVTGDDNAFFWTAEMTRPWLLSQCDKCKGFIELRRRPEGVTIKLI